MAVSLAYNFNENSTTTIRDYSSNGNDGTATGITLANSTRVGKDAVFTDSTNSIDLGGISYLDGVSNGSIHLGIKLGANGNTRKILTKAGLIEISTIAGSSTIRFSITDSTASVIDLDATFTTDFTDYDLVINSNAVTLYQDGVSVDTGVLSGGTSSSAGSMYIGYDGSVNSAEFNLNELLIFTSALSTTNIQALIDNTNGVLIGGSNAHGFELGDLIGDNFEDYATGTFAAVSYIQDVDYFRIYPLLNTIISGNKLTKAGHIWDTTKDSLLYIDSDEICFYDNINAPADVLGSTKKELCISADGVSKSYTTKTANYTATNSDKIIFCDTSGGSFTITLPSSPNDKKELILIDEASSFDTYPLTVNPNGNNIISQSNNVCFDAELSSIKLFYKGTGSNQGWFII
jgi:hypothetical protein